MINIKNITDSNRKLLLYALRDSDWEVIDIQNDFSDWALDQVWEIESTKINKGFTLWLKFFKYDGIHDGMNLVIAEINQNEDVGQYNGNPELQFDGRKFNKNLGLFIEAIHKLRLSNQN